MRVIYLHQYFCTPSMIGGTRSYEMARHLVSSGHDVHMVTSWHEPISTRGWFETKEAGINVHWLPLPYSNHMSYAQRIRAFLRFAWESAHKAASLGGDTVFATSTPLTIAIPAIYASVRNRIPMVFEVRDMWPDVPVALGALKNPLAIRLAYLLERLAYRHARHIIALAPGMMEDMVSRGVPEKKICVIPNGCDPDLAEREISDSELVNFLARAGKRKIVLYAGAIGRANGCDYLVYLANALQSRNADVCVLMIGDGAEKRFVLRQAEAYGVLGSSFYAVDAMPKERLIAWLKKADMHIALMRGPQRYTKDAVNNKFFDAIAAGKPIAGNFDGFQSRIALESNIGLTLDPSDMNRAADQLIRALGNEDWLAGIPERARALAENRFNWSNLASQLERVLTESVEASGTDVTHAHR